MAQTRVVGGVLPHESPGVFESPVFDNMQQGPY